MKIKTSELSGYALDWAVAECEGMATIVNGEPWIVTGVFFGFRQRPFHPSTVWAQGGPIIERESIAIHKHETWVANPDQKTEAYGQTPLIAAMRCFVASKLGDKVDVPDELVC